MKYFAYCRKSEEDKKRQVLSIESQRAEIGKMAQASAGMEIVAFLEEERTARYPGRPVFNDMMRRIERGEAQGIVAWHPDRLARNTVDGGHIVYLLDRGALTDMKFPAYTFDNTSQGKFMLQIIFSYSKYYVDSLSENVRRGLRRKLDLGVLPGRAPLGYLNDKVHKTILVDHRSFPVVRKIWDLALTGCYQPRTIRDMAEYEWGYRTPRHDRSGGKPLALATIYKILSNRFYTGVIVRKGIAYPGTHRPMVTFDEYERVQRILGRPGRPAKQKHTFAFTGMIRCGSCGCSVTAENKRNRCGHQYTYYHCTKKRKQVRCREHSLEIRELEQQVLSFLSDLRISDRLHRWIMARIEENRGERSEAHASQVAALEMALRDAERNLTTLTDLRVRDLIDDTEFTSRREKLRQEAAGIRETIAARRANADEWFEPARMLILFSNLAVSWFERGDAQIKRLILAAVGSNLTLMGRILSIQALEPLMLVPKQPNFPRLCGFVENVRKMADDDRFKRCIANIAQLEALMSDRSFSPQTAPFGSLAASEGGSNRAKRAETASPRLRHRKDASPSR